MNQSTHPLVAVIDLGTNTFHLLIAECNAELVPVFQEKQAARIGKGGITKGYITEEACQRAIAILTYFRSVIDQYNVASHYVYATATSAFRNAQNGPELVARIAEATGIKVEVISGDREAELIYFGVKAALPLGLAPSMIVDIGGGSVEFIICNQERIFWKQSFEIGGQRLMDMFMQSDPISPKSIERLMDYLEVQLIPLSNAVHQYAPQILVGSSGTFDTLIEMHYHILGKAYVEGQETGFLLPKEVFYRMYQALLSKNRQERLAMPGMIEMRADMIVVACCLVDFLFKKFSIHTLKVSSYALKEGMLNQVQQRLNG